MIRKLTKKDNGFLMKYLNKEKEFNLFIIGDIENFGYDEEYQNVYAKVDEFGNFEGVLLKHYGHYIFYTDLREIDIRPFCHIVLKDKNAKTFSGKKEIVDFFNNELQYKRREDAYFAVMNSLKVHDTKKARNIEIATPESIEEIVKLRELIDEFREAGINVEALRNTIESKAGRYYYVRENSTWVSLAASTTETKELAMIGSVCTHPEYRNMGFASECVYNLCKDLIDEGKTPCLFYDNPKAGSIYKGLGFKEIGIWSRLML